MSATYILLLVIFLVLGIASIIGMVFFSIMIFFIKKVIWDSSPVNKTYSSFERKQAATHKINLSPETSLLIPQQN